MPWNYGELRRSTEEAREAARQMREQATRARRAAKDMSADNTERRVRMGQLLWRVYRQSVTLQSGRLRPRGEPRPCVYGG